MEPAEWSFHDWGLVAAGLLSVAGVVVEPFLGPLFGAGLVTLGYAEREYDGALELGHALHRLGIVLAVVGFLRVVYWLVF
ncbi:MAG: hypothetical protein ACOCT0_02000 [Halobacteriota archaeon]